MNLRTGAVGLLLALAILLGVAPARADLVESDRVLGASILRWSRIVYNYLPTLGAEPETWAEREIHKLYMSSRRRMGNGLGFGPQVLDDGVEGRPSGSPDLRPAVPPGSTIVAGGPYHEPTDGLMAGGFGGPAMVTGGGEGGEGLTDDAPGDAIDLGGIAEELIDQALGEIPGFAFGVADALMTFSDSTTQLIMSLRLLLSDSSGFDWSSIFKGRPQIQSAPGRAAEKEKRIRRGTGRDDQKRRIEEELNRKQIRRVARSLFKILLGIGLGLILWHIVRRTESGQKRR